MRVVVADDSVLLREGVVRLLEEKGFDVVAQAGDAEDLIRKVNAHKPDVAVVDIRMPPTNTDDGLHAAALGVDGHHRRLGECDPPPALEYERVGGTEVDCHVTSPDAHATPAAHDAAM